MKIETRLRLAWFTVKSDIVDIPVRVFGRRVRAETAAAVEGSPGVILDVCTGTGSILLEYAGRFPGARIVAVDFEQDILDVARARLEDRGFTNLETIAADARQIPAPACSVDVANISFGLHENKRPDRGLILGECRRVLRPGGLLVVSDYREVEGLAGSFLMRLYLLAVEPRWVHEIFRGGLGSEVRGAGFVIESTRLDLPLTQLVVARKPQA